MMFSLVKYNESTDSIRGNQILDELIEKKGVSKLWVNSDHVFLTVNDSKCLYCFDSVPQLKFHRSISARFHEHDCILDESSDKVLEVIWESSQPSLLFVVYENGLTSFWEFLHPSLEWTKHKTIQISNAKGSHIIDVEWHNESSHLFWCEKRGLAADLYCICSRRIDIQHAGKKIEFEIGPTRAILHNCLAVKIFAFEHGICVQPCQIFLERILIFWSAGSQSIQAVVIKDGKVQESVKNSSDFRDITTSLVGSWTDNTTRTCLGLTVHPTSKELLLLSRNTSLFKISYQNTTQSIMLKYLCNLSQLPLNIYENSEKVDVFAKGLIFVVIDVNCGIYIYDITSGKLLQVLQRIDSTTTGARLLISSKNEEFAIFWSHIGIWKLLCVPFKEIIEELKTRGNDEISNGRIQSITDKSVSSFSENPVRRGLESNESTSSVSQHKKSSRQSLKDYVLKNANNAKSVFHQINQDSTRDEFLLQEKRVKSGGSITHVKRDSTVEEVTLYDIVNWLSLYGFKSSSTALLLEQIISLETKAKKVPSSLLKKLQLLGKEVLQSSAILWPLFEQYLALTEECKNELKEFLDEIEQSSLATSKNINPLNMKILPFLRKFQECWMEQTILPSVDLGLLPKVVDNDVTVMLNDAAEFEIDVMVDPLALQKIEMLAVQQPECLMKAFVTDMGENSVLKSDKCCIPENVVALLRAELKDRRWKRRRNEDRSRILRIFMQLLYQYCPEKLLDIVDMAKQCIMEGANEDEATQLDLKECVQNFFCDYLANVWSEDFDKKRIMVHADIFLRLGLNQEALSTLLQRSLWQEAVDIYSRIIRSTTNNLEGLQLYHTLLAGILRGSKMNEDKLLKQVFEMKPVSMDVRVFLEICSRNTQNSEIEPVFKEHSLTVGEAKKTILKFLCKP